jgi:hypothetical protein
MGKHLAFTKDIGGMNQSKFYAERMPGKEQKDL